jgi:DNA-nicking Smr family endonuclease
MLPYVVLVDKPAAAKLGWSCAMRQDEALHQLEEYFSLIGAKPGGGQRVCLVIPGAGHHSEDHHAVLKPAVEGWLRKQGYSFEVHDAGSFDVKV